LTSTAVFLLVSKRPASQFSRSSLCILTSLLRCWIQITCFRSRNNLSEWYIDDVNGVCDEISGSDYMMQKCENSEAQSESRKAIGMVRYDKGMVR
jgi:hypothetical protein